MSSRFDSRSFQEESLPPWRSWVSRISGVACFLAAVMAGIAIWREPSVVGVLVFGTCAVVGAVLIALPEYFRYFAALREMPPLPGRVEEAFDEMYENLREMRDAVNRVGEIVEGQDEEIRALGNSGGTGEEENAWKDEVEEAVVRLRLDCDAIEERLRPILPDEEKATARSLPKGLLAKALTGAGRGKGFPLPSEGQGPGGR